jgi:hypothetical protein
MADGEQGQGKKALGFAHSAYTSESMRPRSLSKQVPLSTKDDVIVPVPKLHADPKPSAKDPKPHSKQAERAPTPAYNDSKTRIGIDFGEVDRRRRDIEAAQQESAHRHNEALLDAVPTEVSSYSRGILKAMGLLREDEPINSSIFGPGRASLRYDFKGTGTHQPRLQLRSQAEVDSLRVSRRKAGSADVEEGVILKAIHEAFNPPAKESGGPNHDLHDDVFDDMFADDDNTERMVSNGNQHRDRLQSSMMKQQPTASNQPAIPVAVQKILDAGPPLRAEKASSHAKEDDEGDDYMECYPGVYEAAGMEFDSEGEAEEDGWRQGKKRNAKGEERRLDKEVGRIEKLMRDK